jgi:hypothetical protein
MSGTVAFQKLEQLANPQRLASVIQSLNFGAREAYDERSCFMNMVAIVKTLTNQPIPKSTQAGAMTGFKALSVKPGMSGIHTDAVMTLLDKGKLLVFSLTFTKGGGGGAGDHYFCAFALESSTIIVSMGWQGIYDLGEYFAQNHQGRFKSDVFKEMMRKIEDGDVDGVEGLCGFLGSTSDGKGIPQAIAKEVAGCKPKVVTNYLDLPPR